MNLRHFTLAILISAFPQLSAADAVKLDKGDFLAAEQITREGETLVRVKLSKSGKAKLRKLNQTAVNKEVHSEIGGVTKDFKLREPILGDDLEMGPYSQSEAKKVVAEVNKL